MIVLAHISDTHLDGTRAVAERAERVMAYLNGLRSPVDAVLVTGDIADHGLSDEYEQARTILDSPSPVLLCPGNHDERAAFRKVLLADEAIDEANAGDAASGPASPINRVREVAGAVFALCDSTIPGRADGLLADETLRWLEAVLAATPAGTPVLVCFHHPPVTLHSPYVDEIRQHGEDRLATLIDRYPRVAAVLCGHAHTPAATTFAGRPLLVAPGIASTVRLPWERGEVLDYGAPPAVAFHILDAGRLTTHYRVVV